jgi:hypothetical protein
MHKKLITACLALFALAAFALPAAAQAVNHPVLTHPTGTILATKTKITATNVGETLLVNTATSATELACTKASMTGELIKNETGNIQGNITAASFTGTGSGGACTGSFLNPTIEPTGLPWCLKSNETMATDEFQVLGGKCTEAAKKITFVLRVAGGECEYQSTTTTGVKGTFTTDSTGDALLSTPRAGHTANEDAGFTKIRDTVIFHPCPSSNGLQMTFTLETDVASPVEPLYISE